jgi:hypothetical protein
MPKAVKTLVASAVIGLLATLGMLSVNPPLFSVVTNSTDTPDLVLRFPEPVKIPH